MLLMTDTTNGERKKIKGIRTSETEVYTGQAHKQREGKAKKPEKTKNEQTEREVETNTSRLSYTKSNSLPPSNITSLQLTVQVFFASAVALLLHTSSINLLTAITLPTTSTSC